MLTDCDASQFNDMAGVWAREEMLAEWDRYVAQNNLVLVTPKEKPVGKTCLYQFCIKKTR